MSGASFSVASPTASHPAGSDAGVADLARRHRQQTTDILLQLHESSEEHHNQRWDAVVAQQQQGHLFTSQQRLISLAAFCPLLAVNVAGGGPGAQHDALLYFHTLHVMMLLASPALPLTPPGQSCLLAFLESLGIEAGLVRELSTGAVAPSESTGEFLIQTFAYLKWSQHARDDVEPLESVMYSKIIMQAEPDAAMTALVDIAAVHATGALNSAQAAYVFRLFSVLNAVLRRKTHMQSEAPSQESGIRRVVGLESEKLREAKAKFDKATCLRGEAASAFTDTTHQASESAHSAAGRLMDTSQLVGEQVQMLRDMTTNTESASNLRRVTDQAEELGRLLYKNKLASHVNIIPYNPVDDAPDFKRPGRASVLNFKNTLERMNVPASIRQSRGLEAAAACGQLRNAYQKNALQAEEA